MMLIHNEEYEALIAARDELADIKAMLVEEDKEYDSLADNVDDFPLGVCNPNAPEECESCQ